MYLVPSSERAVGISIQIASEKVEGAMNMKGFCPSCERETELVHIQKIEEINIKGETIPIEVDRFRCEECGEEFDNPSPVYDPLAAAYREYRRRKGMVQPEQIRAFREKYGFTQKELSDLLGFGGATLSRYENGTLQDEAHNTILRLALEPYNLQLIIEEKPDVLSVTKRQKILDSLQSDFQNPAFLIYLQSRTANLAPSMLNGFRKLDLSKVLSAIKILAFRNRVYITKLNKLLFYADFKQFQQNSVSITGLCYVHLPLGPVPDQYKYLYECLPAFDPALRKEEDISIDCSGEFFFCENDHGQADLSLTEIQTLMQVKEYFKNFTTRRIVDFSHEEHAYQATQQGEIIPYAYARNLKI